MADYIIMTDSGSDIRPDTLLKWGVPSINLEFRKKNEDQTSANYNMPADQFYKEMKEGTVFQTSAANPEDYKKAFEEELKRGNDIVYLALSSGLSASKNSADLAAEEINEEYSDRRVVVIDSLCASAGLGFLVYLAVKKRNEGYSIDDLCSYLDETIPKICHWFTVDDLKYLKRGGRISATAAFAASILDIKPVMHMDDEGHLVGVSKVRGRRQAIKAMAEKYQLLSENPGGEYFISHGDCPEGAELLEEMISQKNGQKATCITEIGPVIGSHSGPGTLALFFIGKNR